MTRHVSTRVLGAALALAFGLAMAGPEVHQCPLHDAPVPEAASHAHHEQPADESHNCTCPQSCGPVAIAIVALTSGRVTWNPAAPQVFAGAQSYADLVLPAAPRHFLPFALAPPRALA